MLVGREAGVREFISVSLLKTSANALLLFLDLFIGQAVAFWYVWDALLERPETKKTTMQLKGAKEAAKKTIQSNLQIPTKTHHDKPKNVQQELPVHLKPVTGSLAHEKEFKPRIMTLERIQREMEDFRRKLGQESQGTHPSPEVSDAEVKELRRWENEREWEDKQRFQETAEDFRRQGLTEPMQPGQKEEILSHIPLKHHEGKTLKVGNEEIKNLARMELNREKEEKALFQETAEKLRREGLTKPMQPGQKEEVLSHVEIPLKLQRQTGLKVDNHEVKQLVQMELAREKEEKALFQETAEILRREGLTKPMQPGQKEELLSHMEIPHKQTEKAAFQEMAQKIRQEKTQPQQASQ